MTRFRLFIIALLVLAIGSCKLLNQQENFVSFTLDGTQYFFTASDDDSGHPYAVGYVEMGNVVEYEIFASATSEAAAAGTDTIIISFYPEGEFWWYGQAEIYDSLGEPTWISLSGIPAGMMDTFITNLDEVGEQFAGSMPGPFQGESPELKNIVFSVERLPNEEAPLD
jgi:hypothetical protein